MSNLPLTVPRALVFFGLRAAAAILLIALLAPPCVDAFFRPFHAWYWAQDPQRAPSTLWLPAYTWVYGTAVKLTGETVWTPGLLSAVFFLGTLGRLYRALPPSHRTVALLWVGLTPLSWVVASTGLSEAFFGFCLVFAVTELVGYGAEERGGALSWAAVAMLLAACTRYDAWPLLPLFCLFALRAARAREAGPWAAAWALLPLCAPLGWMMLSYARRGDALWFMTSVANDHFGATDPMLFLSGPGGLSLGLAAVGIVVGLRGVRRAPGLRVYTAMVTMTGLFVAWLFASGNLPSQLPERMVYPALLMSAPLVGSAWARWAAHRQLALVAGLLVASTTYLVALPDAVPPAEGQLARLIDEAYAGGQLAPDRHVLVSGAYPEMTAVLIRSRHGSRVHLEGVGRRCPHQVLTCDSPCGAPAWRDAVSMVLVGAHKGQRAMVARGWTPVTRVGPYQVFFRLGEAPPLCARTQPPQG